MLLQIALVGLGGAAGSIARYLIGLALQGVPANGFPLGTLFINVLGCALIGLVMGLMPAPSNARLAVTVGVLGGFTTFSSFGWEAFALLRNGQTVAAVLYVSASNILGFAAVFPAYILGTRLAPQ